MTQAVNFGTVNFGKIQKLGRALMLPIAVLPVAGLLLRFGQDDLLGRPDLLGANAKLIAQAGGAVFDNLPILFAIGVAVGFAIDNAGVAGLAGGLGYLIMNAILKTWEKPGVKESKIDMGVLGGILIGVTAGLLYNRYKDTKLPDYLAFFGGKRFVPIVTGLTAVVYGIVFGFVWPPIQHVMDLIGQWLLTAGSIGVFIYGVLNRVLLVTGLHHVLNSMVWFIFGDFADATGKVAHGDLHRFFAGDPQAGIFMTGFFPVMMFGLPAACLAMYRTAKPENRKGVGGLLLSMALTAFLTGVTEPVEFAFVFLAPALYAVHAVLTGIAFVIVNALHIRLGFNFSAGIIDYVLSFGRAENPWLLIPVGAAYFAVYYGIFVFCIRHWNLATPGREPADTAVSHGPLVTDDAERAYAFIKALGGATNLRGIDACTTRLRLTLDKNDIVDEPALRRLGAKGIVRPGAGSLQVVLGPEADRVADTIRAALAEGGSAVVREAPQAAPAVARIAAAAPGIDRAAWVAALGGEGNLRVTETVAGTRLRAELVDADKVDEGALKRLGAKAVMRFSSTLVHVIVGPQSGDLAAALVTS
ncbi:N-acetylglucosamine-specific PTS transporter subunit IIBC [Pendulispora albinea]|uniref:N-acetylglucosamine-specific PTS transporter subunit IIBC n=1 Tax=Pendulispora albinea TaxID=2741071 RepID=A0ABZ2M2U1_9BACT